MNAAPDFQSQLDAITLHCGLGHFMLRGEPERIARIVPRPEVRVLGSPPADQIECARREVSRIEGVRMFLGSEQVL